MDQKLEMSASPRSWRLSGWDWTKVFLLGLAYFFAHWLAFAFPDAENNIMLVWPAAGVGLAAFLMNPRRLWPALAGGFYLAGIAADMSLGHRSFMTGVGFMTGNMVESIGCAWLVLYCAGRFQAFCQVGEVLALIAGTIFVNALSSCIGAWTSVLTQQDASFAKAWWSWYISDGLGVLLIGPFLVAWTSNLRGALARMRWGKALEGAACLAVWSAVSAIIFYQGILPSAIRLHPYVLVALLAWPALRLGQRGVTLSLVVLFALAVTSPGIVHGPSPMDAADRSLGGRLLELQLFIGFLAIVGYLLAAGHAGSRRAEEALRTSEERFRALADHTPDHIVMQDRDLRYTLVVNPQLGLTEADMIGKTDADFLNEADAQTLAAIKRKVLETGEPFSVEVPLQNLNGQTEYFDGAYVPMRDLRGTVTGVIGYFRNVTEHKRMKDNYHTLFREMLDGFALHEILCDDQGRPVDYRFLAVNPAFERLTGLKADDIVGRRVLDVMPGTETHWIETFGKVALTGEPAFFSNYSADLKKHFEVTAFRPAPNQFACMFMDITERRRQEVELREKNDELTRFTYTVSHDLKSPLVTIQTFLGYLEKDVAAQDAARMDKDLGFIRTAASKMSSLLDELVELSRIGRKTNPPEDVSLQVLVKDALAMVAGRIEQRGVKVDVTPEPIVLHGDRARLAEVFQNLLDNAAKFMGAQQDPRIEIGAQPDGGQIVLFVRDNGMGIDPRHQGKLFGLFEKLDPRTEGSGMGLALVRRVVEVHGGKVWVESPGVGQGSTFRFTLANMRKQST